MRVEDRPHLGLVARPAGDVQRSGHHQAVHGSAPVEQVGQRDQLLLVDRVDDGRPVVHAGPRINVGAAGEQTVDLGHIAGTGRGSKRRDRHSRAARGAGHRARDEKRQHPVGHRRWIVDLERLEELVPRASDAAFCARFAAIKQANKEHLAGFIARRHEVALPTDALFDIQIKRIHEYKRQLLNILEAVATYADLVDGAPDHGVARVKIFAGKAAPSYQRAKLIIKFINDVAKVVNREPMVGDRLKILFLPNYNVSLAQILIPAAELSEQISTAGMEASGTGNMKFGLNGALTIGTLDGANVEMLEHVGPDNIFIFGLTAQEIAQTRQGGFSPRAAIEASPRLTRAFELIESGHFSPDDPGRFRPLLDDLATVDHFRVTADFDSYAAAQRRVEETYAQPEAWWPKAVLNTARLGWFSSDRTVRDYAHDIWRVPVGS